MKDKINEKISLDNFIIVIALLSLFFTFTNFVPISAIVSLMIIFLPYYMYKERKKLSKLTIFLFVFFILMAILAMIYDLKSIFKYQFYRRDGNLFITYAPLLILPLVKNEINMEKLLETFLKISTIIIGVLITIFIVNSLRTGTDIGVLNSKDDSIAFLMFKSHNAAGGFVSTILCLSIGYFIYNKSIVNAEIVLINIIALVYTDSRGSIVGVVVALIMLLSIIKPLQKFKVLKNLDIVIFIISFMTIFIISATLMINIGDSILIKRQDEFVLQGELDGISEIFNKVGRSYTIINRTCYLWPRAVKLFVESPIIGTGFGSYTDMPYNLVEIIPAFLTVNSSAIEYSDSHAHNSYLHVLAETGLLGFVALMVLLYIIRKSILNIDNKTIRMSLYLAFICIVFSSFTEHRLFTPSQVLPFTILLGLCLANKNIINKN